jgi:hypothetical protein
LHVFIVNQAIKGRAKSEKRACCQRVGKIKFIMKTKVLLGGLAIAIFAQVGCKKDIPNPEGQKVPGQQSFSIAASHPEETTDVLAALETFFEGVVADNLEDMNYHQAVWTVEAALNFAYRRSQGPFDTYLMDSLYVSLNNPEDEMDGSQIRQIFLDLKETIDQNTAGMEFGGVAYVDVTPAANLDWHVTVVFADPILVPDPVPSIGDWQAVFDMDCQNNSFPCALGNNAGSKTASLINMQYYHDLFHNQGLNPSLAHFHSGIHSVGIGYSWPFRCGNTFAIDNQLDFSDLMGIWPLYGFNSYPVTYGGPAKCIQAHEIELYATLLTSETENHNPTDQKRIFFFEMGVDITPSLPPTYAWFPAVFKFGNFHYLPQNHTFSGY